MPASSTPKGHVVNRPHSPTRISGSLIGRTIPYRLRHHNEIWSDPDGEAAHLPQGCLAITRVENIHAGRPEYFPNKEPVEPISSRKTKYSYTAVLSKYGKQKDGVVENRYDFDIFENVVSPEEGKAESNKIAAFRFGSSTKLEVHLLPEFREIQLFKYFPNTPNKAKLEDTFWTLNLSQNSNHAVKQGYQFWKILQSTLEKLPLSHLSYANVHRQLVGPAPVSNLHRMQSRAKTSKDSAASLFHLDNRNTIRPAQGPQRLEPNAFCHLADPSFVAEFEKVVAGMGSDEQPPSFIGQNTTAGCKGKKRRAKKAAKAERLRQEKEQRERDARNTAPTSKRGASESPHAVSRKRRR